MVGRVGKERETQTLRWPHWKETEIDIFISILHVGKLKHEARTKLTHAKLPMACPCSVAY